MSFRNLLRKTACTLWLHYVKLDFLIIGVQKGGTSSLFRFLEKHPQCLGSERKELHFFDIDARYSHGKQWYHSQFSGTFRPWKHRFFEATPGYLFRPRTAERIYRYNPKIKLIVSLREPVSRAYSAYNMWRQFRNKPAIMERRVFEKNPELDRKSAENMRDLLFGKECPSFEMLVESELERITRNERYIFPSFVAQGIYHEQFTQYLKFFPKNQILIFENTELRNSRLETLQGIEAFLGLSPFFCHDTPLEDRNVRDYEAPISQEIGERLREFYYPHNMKLFRLLHRKFEW
ncbi:hypothetical protein GF339_20420 [candidate division KSB3 bacterium]|uniref:Sulfotransferase domain-containing protein n=1 Tax=candidate division KSB3 bacterium TaxID=2044937 RepID=A0A9D5K056_9BACT|nr:hypothetical protein [candidate division KSB3 bacterium]MBD3326962.1 hypothetical protein [candidate division KSB3 bacterium]